MSSLVIGDSLLKNLYRHPSHKLIFRPGYSLVQFLEDICLGVFDTDLESVSTVIFLVGANDVPLLKPENVVHLLVACAQALLTRKRGLKVGVCSILPQPKDGGLYMPAIRAVNAVLKSIAISYGFTYLFVAKPFLFGNKPNLSYFTSDGLHLTKKGDKSLFNSFCSVLYSTPNKLLRSTCQQPPITAFKQQAAPLSNFYPCNINYNGRGFHCVEQAYQFHKALHHETYDLGDSILGAGDAALSKRLGSGIRVNPSWVRNKASVIFQLLCVKSASCPLYKAVLLENPKAIFLEDTKNRFWGAGSSGEGRNTLGCLHIWVRNLLQRGLL